jgi:uncharacterized protein (TIRG00374 family)
VYLPAASVTPESEAAGVATVVELTSLEVVPARASGRRGLLVRMTVGLLIGAFLVLVFLRFINLGAALRSVEHLNPGVAVLSGLVFLSAYAVRALRWRRFLAPDEVQVRRVVSIYLVAVFLNWALPIQGGELAKSAILRKTNGIPVSRSLGTVSMDKAMDLLPGVALLIAVPFAHLHLSGALWFMLLLASVGFVGLIFVLTFAAWRRDQALAWVSRAVTITLPRRLSERVNPFVAQFVDTMLRLVRQPRLMLIASMYTVVAASLDALFCYLAFRAVGTTIPLGVAFYGYTFYNLAYILPTPPGHVGTNEVVGLLVFSGVFGVRRSAVGAMFLFSHPWTGLLMTTSGLVALKVVGLRIPAALSIGSDSKGEVEK